jgi:hypothetical protein
MKRVYWISLFLIIAVIGTTTFFARRYYTAKRPLSIEDRIEVLNETTAIRIVSKKVDKEVFNVEMQNAGDRPILAYRLDLRNEDKFVTDYSIGEPLAPGRKTTAVIPLKNLIKNEITDGYLLIISMALFSDGSGEGNQAKLESQRNKYIGMAMANRELFKLVNQLSTEGDLRSIKFTKQVQALKMLMPTDLSSEQHAAYLNTLDNLHIRAEILQKAPDKNFGDINSFKAAFARQMRNLEPITPKEPKQ